MMVNEYQIDILKSVRIFKLYDLIEFAKFENKKFTTLAQSILESQIFRKFDPNENASF